MEKKVRFQKICHVAHEVGNIVPDILEGGYRRRLRKSGGRANLNIVKDFGVSQTGALLGGTVGACLFPFGELIREIGIGVLQSGPEVVSPHGIDPTNIMVTAAIGFVIGGILDNQYSWRMGRRFRHFREEFLLARREHTAVQDEASANEQPPSSS